MNTSEAPRGLILVVEDNDAVRLLLTRVLIRAGYTVHTAIDGPEALATLDAYGGSIGVVCLDLTLPGLSGEEVLVRIRALQPTLPIILMSGFDARMIHPRTIAAAAAFLPKPFSLGELLDAVLCATTTAGRKARVGSIPAQPFESSRL